MEPVQIMIFTIFTAIYLVGLFFIHSKPLKYSLYAMGLWFWISKDIAFGLFNWIDWWGLVLMINYIGKAIQNPKPAKKKKTLGVQRPNKPIPVITGKEDCAALINVVCPYCQEDEWRIEEGLNYCEHNGAPFIINKIPYDWDNAGRGPKSKENTPKESK
jgi:hypothetical protein